MMPEEKVGAVLLVAAFAFIVVLSLGAWHRHEVATTVGLFGSLVALIFHQAWDRLIAPAPRKK